MRRLGAWYWESYVSSAPLGTLETRRTMKASLNSFPFSSWTTTSEFSGFRRLSRLMGVVSMWSRPLPRLSLMWSVLFLSSAAVSSSPLV